MIEFEKGDITTTDDEEDLEVEVEVLASRIGELVVCPSPQVPNAGKQPAVHQLAPTPQNPNLEQQLPKALPWHVYRAIELKPHVPSGDISCAATTLVVELMELDVEVLVDEKRVVDEVLVDEEVLVVTARAYILC